MATARSRCASASRIPGALADRISASADPSPSASAHQTPGVSLCTIPSAVLVTIALLSGALARTAAQDTPGSSDCVLRGRVIACPEGRALAGARIHAYDLVGPAPWGHRWPWPCASDEPLAVAVADDQGSFLLTLPGAARLRTLGLQAEAPGRAAVRVVVTMRVDSGPPGGIEFALPPGASCAVHVIDAQGAPVEGARALLIPSLESDGAEESFFDGRQALHLSGATGPDGVAQVPGISPGCYLVRVSTGGRGGGQAEVTIVGGEVIEIRLEPPRAAAGHVVSKENGKPLANVRVDVHSGPDIVAAGRSGADGAYRMVDLPPGTLTLMWQAAGFYFADLMWPEGSALPESIPLSPVDAPGQDRQGTAGIRGTLRLGASGLPIPDVEVQVGNRRTTSDADGRFQLDGLSAGNVDMMVGGPECEVSLGEAILLLQEGEVREDVEVECREWPCRLRGRVLEASGRPAVGARVFAVFGFSTDGRRLDRESRSVHAIDTDLDGSFRATVPTDASCVVLVAIHPVLGRARSAALGIVELPRKPPIELTLEGVFVTGTLRDSAGAPMAGTRIRWEEAAEAWFEGLWPSVLSDQAPQAVTDLQGRFQLAGLPPGPAGLRVLNGTRDEGIQRWLWLEAGNHREPIDLRLRPARTLRGRVRDDLGFGAFALIIGESASGTAWQGTTTAGVDGEFELTDLPPATWGVHVRAVLADRSVMVRNLPVGAPITIAIDRPFR